MKLFRVCRVLCFALLLVGVSPGSPIASAAEVKIGTVDLKEVFDRYYKKKLADASIQEEATGLQREQKALVDDYKKSREDYKKALDEANNQAVSAEEREKRKKEAEGRLIRINELQQNIEQFERTARGNIEEKLRQTREKILAQIRKVVSAEAKGAGYSLVLDSTTSDPGGLPSTVLFHDGTHDLTSVVIEKLNADAPPDLSGLGDQPGEKKDSKDGGGRGKAK